MKQDMGERQTPCRIPLFSRGSLCYPLNLKLGESYSGSVNGGWDGN